MRLLIQNKIRMEQEVDLVHEEHDCQLTKKGGFDYLVYQNEEKEKVVIKFNEREMVMTRFSQPQTIMRFQKDGMALATIPTPMGLQKLLTKTHRFEADLQESSLEMSYDLLTNDEAEQPLASYELSLTLLLD